MKIATLLRRKKCKIGKTMDVPVDGCAAYLDKFRTISTILLSEFMLWVQ